MSRSTGPVVSVVVATALLTVLAGAVAAVDAVAPARAVRPPAGATTIASAVAACPSAGGPAGSRLSVTSVVPGLTPAPAGAGRADLLQLAAGQPVASHTAADTAVRIARDPKALTLVASASGAWAPGFSAGQMARTMRLDDRSRTGAACVAPGTEFWFVGGSTEAGRRGRLWLVNASDTAAAVDVSLHGPDGPVDAPAGQAIIVPPHGEETIGLDALAPGLPYVAAHVVVRQGRVAAALLQREIDGLRPLGADWVPPAAAPRPDLIVPGVAGGYGRRHLRIVVPSGAEAVVRLDVISGSGAPGGGVPLQVVEAKGGAVTDVDLSRAVTDDAAIRLRADVPVTAGVEVRRGGELGYAAAAAALRGVAVLAENQTDSRVRTVLMLSAVDRPARVRVTPIVPDHGPADPTTLDVPAGSTLAVPIRVPGADRFALVVVPEAGEVFGARYVNEGSGPGQLFTTEPLTPARVTTWVPDVVADLSAAVPQPRSPGSRQERPDRPQKS
jgi:hypothetical protein